MQVFIYCKITLCVSGVHHTHHQEYTKLQLQPLIQVIASEQQPFPNVALATLEEGCCSDTITCTRGCSYSFMYS